MLNYIWPFFILISIIFAFFTGNISNLNISIFESTETAISLCITLVGTMCLWNGIMQIARTTDLIKKITNILQPLIKLLFPKLNRNDDIYKDISMNIVANILGLGNAATPLRFKSNEYIARKKY